MIYNIKTPNKAEKLIFNAFKKALSEDKLRLYIDYSKLNRPGSPVYDPWENLLPILTPTIIGLLLIISSNVIIGLSFIIIMLMIYSSYLKKYFSHRLIERTKNYIIYDYENCEKLWQFGGIVFVNADNKNRGCVSPEGDWKEFVVRNFAYLMTDNNNEKNKDEEPQADKSATA